MSSETGPRAVILGASGAVGGHALANLLRSPVFVGVTSLGRRKVEVAPDLAARLTQHIVDPEDPGSYRRLLAGHTAAICTLGVGEPSKVSREALWRVDVDYAVGFATACREQGVQRFSLLTAVGARTGARMDYLKMKGTLEDRVVALGFRRTSLFQPSMLLTPSNRYGTMQALLLAVWPRIDWMFVGTVLKKYRGIGVDELGLAMARDAERDEPVGVARYTWVDFKRLARG
jgi:uncharacterized protein YbjT (DUF2867 family)